MTTIVFILSVVIVKTRQGKLPLVHLVMEEFPLYRNDCQEHCLLKTIFLKLNKRSSQANFTITKFNTIECRRPLHCAVEKGAK